MKQRFIGVGDELTDDVTVLVRGGILVAGVLREDSLRNHAIYGSYGADRTVDELAQQTR